MNGVTRKAKKLYANVNGVTREIKEMYANVNGVTRKIYQAYPELIRTVGLGTLHPYDWATVTVVQDGSSYKLHIPDDVKGADFFIYPVFDRSFSWIHVNLFASACINGDWDKENGFQLARVTFEGMYGRVVSVVLNRNTTNHYFSGNNSIDIEDTYRDAEKGIKFRIYPYTEDPPSHVSVDITAYADVTTTEFGTFRIPMT